MKVEYRPEPSPPPPPREVVLTCSEREAKIILTALSDMSSIRSDYSYELRAEAEVLAITLRQVFECPSPH